MANLRRSKRIEAQRQRRIAARQGENEEDLSIRRNEEVLARRRERYDANRTSTQREEALAERRGRYAADRSSSQRQEALAGRRERYAADRSSSQRQEALAGRRERYAANRGHENYMLRMRRLNDDCQVAEKCFSCKRKQKQDAQEPYKLQFHMIDSSRIRFRGRFKLNHIRRAMGGNAFEYNLCSECKRYLVDSEEDPKNIWPLFFYCLLFGWHRSAFNGKIYHHSVCGGATLWRLIPQSARSWWYEEISNHEAYRACTLDTPEPVFEDRTFDIQTYNNDYNSGELARICEAMQNHNVVDSRVLCPWGCSVSCVNAGRISLDIVIQRMIPEVHLRLFSESDTKYELVQSCSNCYFREDDSYASILLNPEWKVKPTMVIEDGCMIILTCKWHDGGQDRLTLHTPQSPHGHIFNAEQSDQLAPVVRKHRVTKQMKASKYCTIFQMFQQRTEFSGTSTMDLMTHSDFSKTSELLYQHVGASIIGRNDINLLLSKKVRNNEISEQHAENIVRDARARFNETTLRKYTQGATYVKFSDMVQIQLFESSNERNICVIDDSEHRGRFQARQVFVRRSWPICINILQTEDATGYGTQFRAIPKFTRLRGEIPTGMTWCLFALLSSCPALWRAIDSKPSPFRWSGWEAWILTSVQAICFGFHNMKVDDRSPIKKLKRLNKIVSKVNTHLPIALDGVAASFYRFDIDCFKSLFPVAEYGPEIAVVPSWDAIHEGGDTDKSIVLVVNESPPVRGTERIGQCNYELQVVCILRSIERGRNGQAFDAVRYMRHPNHHCFWKQERNDSVVTKCTARSDIYHELHQTTGDRNCFFYSCVAVYVKQNNDRVEMDWQTKFFEAMGGKSHVKCQCQGYPLLPTNHFARNKKKCNWRECIQENGMINQRGNCQRLESYVCSNPLCSVRLCKHCYSACSIETVTTILPTVDEGMDNNEENLDTVADENVNEESETVLTEEDHGSNDDNNLVNRNDAMADLMENFLVSTIQDSTLDATEDNIFSNVGFAGTSCGDIPINVDNRFQDNCVTGHVIFNQVGSCLRRKHGGITGSNPQKYWVQNLCSSSAGESSPLLQPEASMFPRHFYASAEKDRCSILGSRPLFLNVAKTYPYGFASTLQHARIRMTNPSSSTSTDPKLMCCMFDELGNMSLGSYHSRDVFERGFVVDNKTSSGMAVREQGHSNLSECVDSQQMVRNLATSQKYIKWDWFLTFTLNQSMHPGVDHFHEWKRSMRWTQFFDDYNSKSQFEQEELERAMEEASAPHIYSNWRTVKLLLLYHIKNHLSALGASTAIFDRGEYQEDAANVCHDHLIVAIDKSTMNGNVERYVQDLIRTSVFEIIKTNDDIERLLANGLLKSVDEIYFYQELGGKFLPHKCQRRCLKRTGPDDTPDNFDCRVPHPVKDNPDPTQHSYVPYRIKYNRSTLEVLQEIGLFTPLDDASNELHGTFGHPYFNPTRHIAPCNFNAECKMSPVIPDFFLATKSTQNAQALANTDGLAKYVCKYITWIDQDNYVILCQDVHTGQWLLGKTFLHNTKIVSSNINEEKAFQKLREKNHPKGRDMAYFEIRQIIMGDPEVFTDLTFIVISTLPFELRSTNLVQIDDKGNVIGYDPNYDAEAASLSDAYIAGIPMQRARMQFNLSQLHWMTSSQMLTYRNHNGVASKYDMISLFSLRPPELLGVFQNPVDYYRYCFVGDKVFKEEDVENMLCNNLRTCPWIDCLGRQVKIYHLAVTDVLALVASNLLEQQEQQATRANASYQFRLAMNRTVRSMLEAYQTYLSGRPQSNRVRRWVKNTIMSRFIERDTSMDNLPIPVLTDVRPGNAHQFLSHIVLSLGKYDTEIDALTHATTRDCLKAAKLIGNLSDAESLKNYSNQLTRKYIKEQVVYYAISMSVAEHFIVMSKKVFDDAIVKNCLSMGELPPFTMATLRTEVATENQKWWEDMKNSQLDSIYSTLQHTEGIPPRSTFSNVTRDRPFEWSPTSSIQRKQERQSEESYQEQMFAINLEVNQINRYRNANQEGNTTYLKNTVVFGAPGTGKSFVCQVLVLYALLSGLNVITTALMGIRANALGGLHLHELFKLPTSDQSNINPYKAAEMAIDQIMRNPVLLHALRTVDVIFIDECSQVSAEYLSTIDIILRKVRGNSQTPFGGVHIKGTMDPTQLQPINQLPFLVSSFMLTCFLMVELEHSVRAHRDNEFQRLQQLSRMDPYTLRSSQDLKDEFYEKAGRLLTFVPNWDDKRIGPNMMRAFSRKIPAQQTLVDYRERIKNQLTAEGIQYRLAHSKDTYKTRGSSGDFTPANEQSIKTLNHELKEPSELVLFPGGIYECTINDQNKGINQSQFALLLELPSEDSVLNQYAIKMWIAPPSTGHIAFDHHHLPTRTELEALGWKETNIGVAPARDVNVRGGLVARRVQYSLKHIGATTINKAQGATLPYGIAIEISEKYSPWESGQIVVSLSRSETAEYTIIVGDKHFAIDKMWELITTGNQWTRYMQHVLKLITVSKDDGNVNAASERVLFHTEAYPFRVIDATIPTDNTGYVYCLVSLKRREKIYIGQTQNLSQRFESHNNGTGANETRDPRDHPWAIAAYICGLSHMNKRERMSLEKEWKELVNQMQERGIDDSFAWIMAGTKIVTTYNDQCTNNSEMIRFVAHVTAEIMHK